MKEGEEKTSVIPNYLPGLLSRINPGLYYCMFSNSIFSQPIKAKSLLHHLIGQRTDIQESKQMNVITEDISSASSRGLSQDRRAG